MPSHYPLPHVFSNPSLFVDFGRHCFLTPRRSLDRCRLVETNLVRAYLLLLYSLRRSVVRPRHADLEVSDLDFVFFWGQSSFSFLFAASVIDGQLRFKNLVIKEMRQSIQVQTSIEFTIKIQLLTLQQITIRILDELTTTNW